MSKQRLLVMGSLAPRFQKELEPFAPRFVKDRKEVGQLDPSKGSFVIILGRLASVNRISLSIELTALYSCYVLLLVESDQLDQAIYQCSQYPVFVLSQSSSPLIFYQGVRLLMDLVLEKIRMEQAVRREKDRFADEKLISQAKFQLVEKLHYTEEQAHQYILKKAMDHSMTKVAVARLLIQRLANRKPS